ncbi:MAG: Crp/Fnr family transcriptional regulator [Rhizobiales bacterium]|nr:Crp/Fnr family transcriptional regulator [Hyphomicrobiales bacterium]
MAEHPDIDILARSELFRGVPLDALREVQAVAFRKRFAAGDTVLRQDDTAAILYVVVVGRLRATQTGLDGQQIIIRYLGPGEVAGYTPLSGGDVHPGTVVAVDDSHLIGMPSAALREIMARHASIAINAASLLGARYRDLQVRLRELATEKVDRRIAHTLLRLAQQAGRRTARGIEIVFPLSRQDLAEMCGTTLHTVSRTLSGWEARGIVDSGRRRVVIAKPDALNDVAEEGQGGTG